MTPYVFDTNSFRVLENYYPERFPTFWKNFDEARENIKDAIQLILEDRRADTERELEGKEGVLREHIAL